MFRLRPYQSEASDQVLHDFASGVPSTLVDWATGLGKTELCVHIASRPEIFSGDRWRTLFIAPLTTLVDQAANKFHKRTGVMPAIEQAENRSNESAWGKSPFVVASMQTLTRDQGKRLKRYKRFSDVGLVVVDECHLSITDPCKEMLDHFKSQGAQLLGVTATARRHDGRGLHNLYSHVSHRFGISDAVDEGWLVSARATSIQLQSLDLSGVQTANTVHGKDFAQVKLNRLLENERTIFEIAAVTAAEYHGEKTVVYCSSVAEARKVSDRLEDNYGIRSTWICADKKLCTVQRRQEALDNFTMGNLEVICNVGILCLGWDFPGLIHIVMASPTQSLPRYQQIFGRGTRALEGVVDFEGSTAALRLDAIARSDKPFFRITDLVDNSLNHKIITSVDVLGGKYGVAVTERVKRELVNGGQVDIDEAMRAMAETVRLEEEEKQRQERAQIEARARYRKVEVNPFEPDQRDNTEREPTEKQLQALAKFKVDQTTLDKLSFREAHQMISSLIDRSKKGLCSFKQSKLLAKFGESTDITFEEATHLIGQIADNGWKALPKEPALT